jgi:spore maturation protein A
MMNYVWFAIFAFAIIIAGINGRLGEMMDAVFKAGETAVTLAFGLIGLMALWLGLMKIAEEAGTVKFIGKILHPFLKWLFPGLPQGHPALGSIVANLSMNVLGLGNSATAMGLKAMQDLQELNPNKDTATSAMCMFLAINTAGFTLVPATIIGIRVSAGSSNPAIIIGTIVFASAVSTVVAITTCKIFEKIYRNPAGGGQ